MRVPSLPKVRALLRHIQAVPGVAPHNLELNDLCDMLKARQGAVSTYKGKIIRFCGLWEIKIGKETYFRIGMPWVDPKFRKNRLGRSAFKKLLAEVPRGSIVLLWTSSAEMEAVAREFDWTEQDNWLESQFKKVYVQWHDHKDSVIKLYWYLKSGR